MGPRRHRVGAQGWRRLRAAASGRGTEADEDREPGHDGRSVSSAWRARDRRRSSCRIPTCTTRPRSGSRLLQGLLDTDGGPVTQRGRSCRIQYTTTLAAAARRRRVPGPLARGRRVLDGPAAPPDVSRVVRTGAPVGYRADAYVLDIRLPERIEPFRLDAQAMDVSCLRRGGRPMRFIDAHRAGGRGGHRLHPGGGGGLALRHGRLPRYAQHPERCVHHLGRGAEHDAGADEDVPHAHRASGRRPS